MKYVVMLETTPAMYLGLWPGDPGRTYLLGAARRYSSVKGAKIALAMARKHRNFECAKIITVDE